MRLVALGDSTSCGQGVGLALPHAQTWPALVAASAPAELHVLARPGARARAVRERQLERAVALSPDVATLLVGLNDVARGGFDAVAVQDDVGACAAALLATGAVVLVVRLPDDPAPRLPLPPALRREVRRRAAAVNAAVEAAARSGAAVVDLGALPVLASAAGWEVDRVHPSALAHHGLAGLALTALARAGVPAGPLRVPAPSGRAPGLAEQGWWLLRHAAPWLVRRPRDVVGPALAAALR